ncbi:hypothetical protein TspCOW1_10400 [Thiohalobacter sp. COW1]|uniref:Cell division protein FtsI n=1 Tax=Thiohalobacter thiocyanaticus TaxID=585455 RepID=A0A1Z4VS17_9GAMM|nr:MULTISPECIES: hypothetical protein [Thiohalobacter]BAZ93994.1 cell division protein FtsI [Thiohalobacter thiocyanaticus]BCO30937.1 hypothetical protein TspCOW1_10400 [Thiohalobacter sp. COW1]
MQQDESLDSPQMDAADLYREEVITDRRVGSIRVLTPVTAEGATDPGRTVVYVGQAQLMTPAGALPLNFEIPAATLAEAVDKFSEATEQAVERTMQELEEMRREAASSIVLPKGGGEGMGGPGGGFGGGMPGGGFQLP